MNEGEVLTYALTLPQAGYDCPFEGDTETKVLRHTDTGKWFGLLMCVSPRVFGETAGEPLHVLNLKCDPERAFELRESFRAVRPAYHMNHFHWVSVLLGADLPDEILCGMIRNSFALTSSRKKR